ncbi:UvrD-helicase domain-containing protein [Cupriavidus taiwanensis]|uniref:UvrD-helicase domain-containing protein n=1 Tax=Cupriavidus taiwanensis TaxID=164546 RepID=UPI000E100059|nr:UvrD-helicase domain-containing protein [Cupriavidus taiwanensis]SOY48453.1 DNA-dependent ATPase I and helicase II [Cupriavidus taiwanensis]SOY48564.1 DNA-dependent ATPase I and helicase II [Cupriavidus taiwanensis]SOY83094.1 DNA-dependent ATPase I and helicase II [Cupriavidus taiwanensis]SOZ56334.1 DNA-dependent ATPase I and helicase II [Cupriavidus taiwanensis]SOZ78867.1 DNA-dependent ATPase I and helicase II [Cupriavidus taiwanensis]
MSDLLANLNAEQLAAVTLPDEPALILAGAGSGKTRVLTTRIAWLLQNGRVSPAGILAVTFTNKASKEMQTRLQSMLPINTRGMWIGTFHGLCNRMLRAHFRDAGLPQTFAILDSQDQLSALKRLLKSLNVDDEKYPAKNLQYFINNAKEQGLRPADVEANDDFNKRFVDLYAAYDQQCQREGVVDFAELLLRCHELLRYNDAIRQHYQHRFRHVLVDEFQDTNVLQYQWLKLLAGHGTQNPAAVFAVGDDDQSIYAFRGANVGNMRDFEHEFRVRRLIKLEQNYRSHGHILDSANHLISHNARRLGKNLRTDAGHGEPVRVFQGGSDGQEAAWIIEEIRDQIAQGASRAEIAILYRSNAQSRVIEHALFSAGIPYRVYGGLRFFERAEIKHALAYMQLLENPRNDAAFGRVVNFPARGIGARSLEVLQDMARQYDCALSEAVAYVPGAAGSKLAAFARLIDAMREETRRLTLPETVEYVINNSGLITYYQGEKEGQDRIENLQELVTAAQAFVTEEGYGLDALAAVIPADRTPAAPALAVGDQAQQLLDPEALPVVMTPLVAFLTHASLEAGDNQAQAGQDAVQMMTVHAAKGLEFDVVFISGLEEGLFPHENSMMDPDGLEEERRLMYVAITRARKRLYMSFAQSRMLHGQTRYHVRSRFFEELPEASLKWLTPPAQSYGGVRRQERDNAWGRDWFRKPEDVPYTGTRPTGGMDNGNGYADARREAGTGFRVGQSVFHNKFGEGVITALEGEGADARANINFKRHGAKWLALAVAKLDAID